MDRLTSLFEDLSKNISQLCIEDITQLEKIEEILNQLLEVFTKKRSLKLFIALNAYKSYLLKLKQKSLTSTFPLEMGLGLIKSLKTHFDKGVNFDYDMTDVIKSLDDTYLKYSEITGIGNRNSQLAVDRNDLPDEHQAPEVPQEVLKLKDLITELSIKVALLSPDEIPEIGEMLNLLDEIIQFSDGIDAVMVHNVARAYKSYTESMVLEENKSTVPLEKGIILLKALVMHMEIDEEFVFDMSDVLNLLGVPFVEENMTDPDTADMELPARLDQVEINAESTQPEEPIEPEDLSEEDHQILSDFVIEATDNLESIEVDIVELEQDPTDGEIINNIFRPFHTIKGVSGFLSLKKMNKLAHMTENLLDSARNNEFILNKDGFDVILQSVDMIKKLLERVSQGLVNNKMPIDHDIDINPQIKMLKQLPEILSSSPKEPLGQILVRQGTLDEENLNAALSKQEKNSEKRIGEVLVEEKLVKPNQVASALMTQKAAAKSSPAHVKVDIDKLGDLVDFSGELVIAQSMLKQVAQKDPQIQKNVGRLSQIVSKIQNIAMSMRMIPIKSTFMKMIRLVRDLSAKSGKNVSLHMVGEDTEIDRNVVDALYEPMVHMIRNSIDHGLEENRDRLSSGKPEQGNIFLRAFHKGGNIIIEIEDDGKGLDREKILEKAISRELIDEKANLSDSQIFELILKPGFSTAQSITDISGRGVGMDVVKSGIEKLRGSLDIESVQGEFTKFTLRLPLTLAIIDGMLVRVQNEKFIIPVMAIQRSFRPEKEECFTVEANAEMVRDRDALIPLLRLDSICGLEKHALNPWEGLVVVVESKDEKKGLLIEERLIDCRMHTTVNKHDLIRDKSIQWMN